MNDDAKEYLKTDHKNQKVIRTEVLFTPLLIVLPLIVAYFFINDWFVNGYSLNNSAFNGELILGIIILVGNIMFDIPFIRSLPKYKKKTKKDL